MPGPGDKSSTGSTDPRVAFARMQSARRVPGAAGKRETKRYLVSEAAPAPAPASDNPATTSQGEASSRPLSAAFAAPPPIDAGTAGPLVMRVIRSRPEPEKLTIYVPVPTANLLGPEAQNISVNSIAETYKVNLTGAGRSPVGRSNWVPVLESLRQEGHVRLRKAMFDVPELSATDTNTALLCLRHFMDIGIGIIGSGGMPEDGNDRKFVAKTLVELESLQEKLADRELSFNPDREPTLQLALTHLCVGAVSIIIENLRSRFPKEKKVTLAVGSSEAEAGVRGGVNPLYKHQAPAAAMLVAAKKDDDVFNALSEAAYKFLASYRPGKIAWIEALQKRPSWIHPALDTLKPRDGGDGYTSLELFIVVTQRLRQIEKAHSDVSVEKLCGGSVALVLVGLFFKLNNPFASENVAKGTHLGDFIPGPTPSSTALPSPLGTTPVTASETARETPTGTPSVAASGTAAETPTGTPSVAASGTAAETPTGTPSVAASGTAAETPTGTPSVAASGTAAETPTGTPSVTASGTASGTAVETPTGTPSVTASGTAVETPTGTPSVTASGTAVETPTSTLSVTASATRSVSPSATPLSCESVSSDYWAFGSTFEGTARMYGLAVSGSDQIFGIGGIQLNGTSNNGLLIFPLGPRDGTNISATILQLSTSDLGIAGAYDPFNGRLAVLSRSRNSTDDVSLVVRDSDFTWKAITWDGGQGDTASSVGFDPMGNIVFSGVARTPAGKDGVVVGKMDSSLADEWLRIIGGVNSTEYAITSIATPTSVYVGGYTYALVEQTNQEVGLLGRLDLDGTLRSTHAVREMGSIWGISGQDNRLYIVGSDSSATSGIIAKIFPQNNTVAWSRAIGNGGNYGRVFQVKETPSGALLAIGQLQAGIRFLVKFSSDGVLLNGWIISSDSSVSAWDISGESPVIGIERGVGAGQTELGAIDLPDSGSFPFPTGYLRPLDSSVQVNPVAISLQALSLPIAPWNATRTRFTPSSERLGVDQRSILCTLSAAPLPSLTASITPSPTLSATPLPTDHSRRLEKEERADSLRFFSPHASSSPSASSLRVGGSRGLRGSSTGSDPVRTSMSGFDITTLASSTLPMVMFLLLALFCCRRHCSTRRPGSAFSY